MSIPSMTAALALTLCLALSAPAAALTNDHGVVVFTQADALAGGVTPGDAPGFPVTISVPGSYRLGSTLTVTTFANGINATAAEVTIDFAGFRLIGSGVGNKGIEGTQRALTVRNGTIRAFENFGIDSNGVGLVVESMRIVQNGAFQAVSGIAVQQDGARIVNSTVTGNTIGGIACARYCYLRGNVIGGNGVGQIQIGNAGLLLGNLLSGDQGPATIPVDTFGIVGRGDNALHGFLQQSIGTFVDMSPNSCPPSGC